MLKLQYAIAAILAFTAGSSLAAPAPHYRRHRKNHGNQDYDQDYQTQSYPYGQDSGYNQAPPAPNYNGNQDYGAQDYNGGSTSQSQSTTDDVSQFVATLQSTYSAVEVVLNNNPKNVVQCTYIAQVYMIMAGGLNALPSSADSSATQAVLADLETLQTTLVTDGCQAVVTVNVPGSVPASQSGSDLESMMAQVTSSLGVELSDLQNQALKDNSPTCTNLVTQYRAGDFGGTLSSGLLLSVSKVGLSSGLLPSSSSSKSNLQEAGCTVPFT